jgi:hypothetical protein
VTATFWTSSKSSPRLAVTLVGVYLVLVARPRDAEVAAVFDHRRQFYPSARQLEPDLLADLGYPYSLVQC